MAATNPFQLWFQDIIARNVTQLRKLSTRCRAAPDSPLPRVAKSGRAAAARAPMLLTVMIAACGSAQNKPAPKPAPAGESARRVVTNLSSISAESAPPPLALLDTAKGAGRQATAQSITSGAVSVQSAADLKRLFLDQPDSQRFGGTAAAPAHETLLNRKAAEFSEFSRVLLHQVSVAAQELEGADMPTATVPENLEPAVLTATMDRHGKLLELVLERHSVSGVVDQLIVKACKRGLWINNPPPAAQTGGEYRIRIEGRIKNFETTDGKHWTFETNVGLALL
jgi:hypothetical protein